MTLIEDELYEERVVISRLEQLGFPLRTAGEVQCRRILRRMGDYGVSVERHSGDNSCDRAKTTPQEAPSFRATVR